MPAQTDLRRTSLQPKDRLLKVAEAADLLGLSIRMVHRLVATGALPKIKIGKAARFRLRDIEALIEKGAE